MLHMQIPPNSTINLQTLQSLQAMVSKDAAPEMLGVIDDDLEDAPPLLPAICAIADISDVQDLEYGVPPLKSTRATGGARKPYQFYQVLEKKSKGGTRIAAPRLLSHLTAEYKRVEATLQTQKQRYQRSQG